MTMMPRVDKAVFKSVLSDKCNSYLSECCGNPLVQATSYLEGSARGEKNKTTG